MKMHAVFPIDGSPRTSKRSGMRAARTRLNGLNGLPSPMDPIIEHMIGLRTDLEGA